MRIHIGVFFLALFQVNQDAGSASGGANQEVIMVILGTCSLLLAMIVLWLRSSVREVPVVSVESDPLYETQPGEIEEVPEAEPVEDEEPEQRLYGRLYVLRGLEEREIIIDCEEFSIGRGVDEECDYVIDQPYVSPRHCSVAYRGGEFIIKDLGSKNGTYVNGERLPREREVIVPLGSEIEITKNIALEIWDPETVVDVDKEVTTSDQEISHHGDEELIFQPMPGIAYADDTEGDIGDNYSPI